MRTHRTVKTALLLALCVLMAGGLAQAQGPDQPEWISDPDAIQVEIELDYAALEALPAQAEPEIEPQQAAPEAPLVDLADESVLGVTPGAAMGSTLPFQGRLTNAGGAPLNGSYSIKLALYDVPTVGTALCEDTDIVSVTSGLFMFVMDYCTAADLDGRQLYLGVKVGADAEMTPRQAIYPVPYARGLQPGAIINQTSTSDRGLTVTSAGSGSEGTALWLENTNTTGGVGVWANAAGGDAAVVAKNTGSGALLKGFGADGGEDEFRITNNGSIETKADSYIWTPGSALVKNLDIDTTRWDIQLNGGARIYRGAAVGGKTVYFPVTLPSVLYGKPVTVEYVTVYYRTTNGANAYITDTKMYKVTGATGSVVVFNNSTDHTSTTDSSYSIAPTTDNELSATEPGVGLFLNLSFANDTDSVYIGGIRIRLGHHSLY